MESQDIHHHPAFEGVGVLTSSYVASIEDPVVIMKILAHLDDKTSSGITALLLEWRAPPLAELLEGL